MSSPATNFEAQAAQWDARLRSPECSALEREQFAVWLARDTAHREAFGRLQSVLHALREAGEHPEARALRECARLMEQRSARRRTVTRWAMAAGVAAASVALALWSTYRGPGRPGQPSDTVSAARPPSDSQVWATGAGQRSTISLPDGSVATLNATTRLEAEWLPRERRIHLLAGEALFTVAKDGARPFIVAAGDRTVTALGTVFDVKLDANRMKVTLVEGRIAVQGLGAIADQPVVELRPSEQLVAIDGALPTVHEVNAAAESAWAQGQVFFTDMALPEAVAQMNRYSVRQIVAGPGLSKYRVNGMFRAGNQEGFVRALTSYFPIEAHRDGLDRIVLKPRRDSSRGR